MPTESPSKEPSTSPSDPFNCAVVIARKIINEAVNPSYIDRYTQKLSLVYGVSSNNISSTVGYSISAVISIEDHSEIPNDKLLGAIQQTLIDSVGIYDGTVRITLANEKIFIEIKAEEISTLEGYLWNLQNDTVIQLFKEEMRKLTLDEIIKEVFVNDDILAIITFIVKVDEAERILETDGFTLEAGSTKKNSTMV